MLLTFLKVQDSGFLECAIIWIVRLSLNILSINTTQMKCVLLGASTIMCFSLRTFSPCILHTNSAITHPQNLSRGGGGGLLSPAAANTAHLHRTFSLFFACYPRVTSGHCSTQISHLPQKLSLLYSSRHIYLSPKFL